MDSQMKVFRAHRALAWFYAIVGTGIAAAVTIGSGRGFESAMLPVFVILAVYLRFTTSQPEHAGREKKAGA